MTDFIIMSKASGKFLSHKWGIFTDDLELARTFRSKESAAEMLYSSVETNSWKRYAVRSLQTMQALRTKH
jgi:hypothetical protein